MIKLIKIGSFTLLAIAIVLGSVVGIAVLVENSEYRTLAQTETTIQLVTEANDEEKLAVEQERANLTLILSKRLSALDVAKVNEILKADVTRVLGDKKRWVEDDLVSALLPHAYEAVIEWTEATIQTVASENDMALTRREVRDYRDAYILSEWPLFMVYYQIAYLKRMGLIVLE